SHKPGEEQGSNMSLNTALTQLATLLRSAPREIAELKIFTTSLIEPLRLVGAALRDEDLDHTLDWGGWDPVNKTGQWARNLLQYSRDPNPDQVKGLLLDFLERGYCFDHLAAHIDRFKEDALAARQRLSGGKSTSERQCPPHEPYSDLRHF